MKVVRILFLILCLVAVVVLGARTVTAQTQTPTPSVTPSPTPEAEDPSEQLDELQGKIKEYEGRIDELQDEARSLSSQIEIVDSQVALTELRISQAETKLDGIRDDIEVTKEKVNHLEGDIDSISKALLNRTVAAYEFGSVEPWQVLLTSESIDNFFTRLKYLRMVQLYDQRNIVSTEQAKVSYANQQEILVEKEAEAEALHTQLEGYNEQLEEEKKTKQYLLDETKGSEAVYQDLLASTRAEYEAIQGIISGRGVESEVGKVNEGERIASIIQGASCNSSGTHLHFIVKSGGSSQNPFSYLGSIDHINNSGGDPFNPSGSWAWPIEPSIRYNQGYGVTQAIRSGVVWYGFHDGIDISSTGSQTVKAVKSGTLFQGSYSGNGGCRLRYVRLRHDDGIDTFYLHINY